MPELPEVETIRKDLTKLISNQVIRDVQILKPKLIKSNIKTFQSDLSSSKFLSVNRRGKLLIFNLPKNKYLLIHLKMTGQLIFDSRKGIVAGGHSHPKVALDTKQEYRPSPYAHIIFNFKNGSKLYFNDQRQFGYLKIVGTKELAVVKAKFGPEPLDKSFTYQAFKNLLHGRRGILKAFLLNQQIIAGIGNIYADEICFISGVRPDRTIDTLTENEKKKLYTNLKEVLRTAIKARGTTFSDFVDSRGLKGSFSEQLQVYGRGGEECINCARILLKDKIAGRGTVYCAHCQN